MFKSCRQVSYSVSRLFGAPAHMTYTSTGVECGWVWNVDGCGMWMGVECGRVYLNPTQNPRTNPKANLISYLHPTFITSSPHTHAPHPGQSPLIPAPLASPTPIPIHASRPISSHTCTPFAHPYIPTTILIQANLLSYLDPNLGMVGAGVQQIDNPFQTLPWLPPFPPQVR